MCGQGSPKDCRKPAYTCIGLVIACLGFFVDHPLLGDESEDGMRLRFSFGSAEAARWTGEIELAGEVDPQSIRILGVSPDHAGRIFLKGQKLIIDLIKPTTYGGLEFEIKGDGSAQVKYRMVAQLAGGKPEPISGDVTLDALSESPKSEQSPRSNARVYLERAPGDELKFFISSRSLVFKSSERPSFEIAVSPFGQLIDNAEKQVRLSLHRVSETSNPPDFAKAAIWHETANNIERGIRYPFEIENELEPGVYDLLIELYSRPGIPFTPATRLKRRKVQFVVVDARPVKPLGDIEANFDLVYDNRIGVQENFRRGRFKPWENLNASARGFLRGLPLPTAKDPTSAKIESGSLQLFPLTLGQKQSMLKLEVDYRTEGNALCDFVVFDRNNSKNNYSELVSASVAHDETNLNTATKSMKFVFWNRSTHPVLMVRNLESGEPVIIERIRVYRFDNQGEEFHLYTNQKRRLFTQFSPAHFSRILATTKSTDEPYSLDNWASFQLGGQRLVQLIKSAGYQGVILDVNQNSSTLYPSRLLQSSPAFDTGTFSQWARDPVPKDILELLFQQFSNNNLTLIPRLEIPEYIAAFESADESFQPDLRLRNADGSRARSYNHLNPHVQNFLSEVVFELVNRYSEHPSFGGICLKIGANEQLIIGKNLGGNDKQINQFLSEVMPDENPDDSPKAKRVKTMKDQSSNFHKWQSERATRFLIKLNEDIRATCQRNLMLDFSDALFSQTGNVMYPDLKNQQSETRFLRELGYDVTELAKAGIVMPDVGIDVASRALADQRVPSALESRDSNLPELEMNPSRIRRLVQRSEVANSEVRKTAFENAAYHTSIPNSNYVFRRDLIKSLARNDVLFFADSFELAHRITHDDSRRIMDSYTNLPNVIFDTVTKNDHESPVIVRKKTLGNESYFYVINQTPWPTRVIIQFSNPLLNLRNVDGTFFQTLEKNPSGGTMTLSLKPFDLVAGRSDQEALSISEVRFSFPKSLKESLIWKKDTLMAKIRFLKPPAPISDEMNPGFEMVNESGQPQKWQWHQSDQLKISTRSPSSSSTNKILVVENKTEDDWGWLRSSYLTNRGTGRISILVSMKGESRMDVPQVRLSIDGQGTQRDYYRFGSFSADQNLPDSARIENDWKVFAVHFNDVPSDISLLRFGIDVLGKGTVLVDDVRVFDRWFDAQDKESLSKKVSLAAHNIQSGEFLKAHRLMNSYWLRFIEDPDFAIENRMIEPAKREDEIKAEDAISETESTARQSSSSDKTKVSSRDLDANR